MIESTFAQTDVIDGVVHATVLCERLAERESQIVFDELTAAAGSHGWKIVVDLTQVAFMPSVGLGVLVNLHNACKQNKGKLALFGIHPELMSMLKLTHLNKLLSISSSKEEAIKAVA